MLGGRYELRDRLGSGGMATVYEAHDDLLGRAVAIKLLRSEGLTEPTARERFAAEARSAASLTHPHAVAVYDVGTGDEQPFIVMELVRGGTLEDVIEEGPMDVAPAVAVGSQVLAALHAAHRRGIVHRDVKPANILVPEGIVPTKPEQLPGIKLGDFGIAKATADATVGLTQVGQVIGTPKYLSPEQVKGERATPQSDLYATAVVLYEMLAGHPPFQQDTALALALAHREDEPPPLNGLRRDLDPNLAALVHQALAKDPADRPRDANEMREALLRGARASPGTQLLAPPASTQVVVPTSEPLDASQAVAPRPPAAGGRLGRWLIVVALLGLIGLLATQWLANRSQQGAPATQTQEQTTPGDQQQDAPAGGQPADEDQAPPADDTAPPQDDPQAVPPDEEPATGPTQPPASGESDETAS